jgi:hypothetical protein
LTADSLSHSIGVVPAFDNARSTLPLAATQADFVVRARLGKTSCDDGAPAFVVMMGVDATRALGVDDDVEVAVKSSTNLGASTRCAFMGCSA